MAIAYVKDLGKIETTGTGSSSAASFTGSTTAGNTIVTGCAGWNGGALTVATTDNKSNTYTKRAEIANATTIQTATISDSVAIATGGASHQITVTGAGSVFFTWTAIEFSGVSAFDTPGTSTTGASTVTSKAVTSNANVAVANSVAVAVLSTSESGTATSGYTSSGGWSVVFSELSGVSTQTGSVAYSILSGGAGATVTNTFGWTPAETACAAISVYSPSGAAATYVPYDVPHSAQFQNVMAR